MTLDICLLLEHDAFGQTLLLTLSELSPSVGFYSGGRTNCRLLVRDMDLPLSEEPTISASRTLGYSRKRGLRVPFPLLHRPFLMSELIAAVSEGGGDAITLFEKEKVLLLSGRRIPLSEKETLILKLLLLRAGAPLSFPEFELALRPGNGSQNTVRVYVSRLNKKAGGGLIASAPTGYYITKGGRIC